MEGSYRYSVAIGADLPAGYPAVFSGDWLECIDLTAQAGGDSVELHVRDPDRLDAAALQDRCMERNIVVSALSTGLGNTVDGLSLIHAESTARKQAVLRLQRHIALAGAVGGSVIVGLVRGQLPAAADGHACLRRLSNGLKELIDSAARVGVVLQLEAISRLNCNYLNSIHETIAYIGEFASPWLRIHIDTFHMNIEDRGLTAGVQECGARLGYVHYSDSNRRRPGAGHIDFIEMTRALKNVGYDGCIGLEYVPGPDALGELRKTLGYLRAIDQMLACEPVA